MTMNTELDESISWFKKTERVIPSGCSTLAKSPKRLYEGYSPFYVESASGSHFIDIDGNEWLDCEMAMGTIVWGHAREEIAESIIKQLSSGVSFSLPAKLELEVAEKILRRIGRYKKLRFCKNGADVISAAIRLARAKTKREIVVCGSYHGWHDWCAYGYYGGGSELGIIESVANATLWSKVQSAEAIRELIEGREDKIACLAVCPGNWKTTELVILQELCRKHSIALIFDEVATFMRAGKNGFTGLKGVWPDLLCISKGLANGLPLAAIVGEDDYMNKIEDIKLSNTHSSELIALSAANACEDLIANTLIWPSWKNKGIALIENINDHIQTLGLESELLIDGYFGCFRIHTPNTTIHNDPFRELFVKLLAKHKIFTTGYLVLSDQHSDNDIELIRQVAIEAIKQWRNDKS